MATSDTADRKRKWRKLATALIFGGVVGFLAATGFEKLSDSGVLGALDHSREIAGLVGVLYVVSGLGIGIGLISPKAGAQFLNVEDAGELREQSKVLGWSLLGMVAIGSGLIALALAAPAGPISAPVSLFLVVISVIAAVISSLRQRRHIDELLKSLGQETAANAFYLLLAGGGGWATLSHLGYVAAPAPLDWMTMFAAALLLGAFWSCGRRGMLTPR